MQSKVGRVAILHYTAPPVVGGVEVVVAAHARLFAQQGYQVTILAGRGSVVDASEGASNHPGITTLIEPLLDSKNSRLLTLNASLDRGEVPADFSHYEAEVFERLQILLQGCSTLFIHNALTLHKNLPLTAALLRLAGTLPAKFVAWCHDLAWTNPLYAEVLHPGYPWELLHQSNPALTYVAISAQRQQEILETFRPSLDPAAIPVIPNGVDLTEFMGLGAETKAVLAAAGLVENQFKAETKNVLLLLLPARLTRRKNIEFGIRVVAALKKGGQAVRLVVTGPPGPHNPKNDVYVRELLALRAKLDVEQEVIFLMEKWANEAGQPRTLSDQVIFELYRYCDALFMPSTQEGFGIPILEAALARLPVFASDIEAFRQLAPTTLHYFALDADPADVAQLILTELGQDKAFLLRRMVRQNYTWDSIFEQQIEPLVAGA